jgi:anti-sigma factor RsiW
MDAQLNRYLDGELSEDEATSFLERLEREPELRQALQEQERLLELARELPQPSPSQDFTDQVMDAIRSAGAVARPDPARPRAARKRWAFALAAAAMILLAFSLGRVSNPSSPGGQALEGGSVASIRILASEDAAGHPVLRPDFSAIEAGGASGLRVVQLVYAPQDHAPSQVAVAGSFNGWKAGLIPMRKQGEAWTATLILPPGSYEYMFIEDDTRWVTDPRAPLTRDDGFGGRNAVLDVDA